MMSRRDLLASAAGASVALAGNQASAAPETSPLKAIRQIDYTIIYVRDMQAMRRFYETVMHFTLIRELSADWVEYGIGDTILALAHPHFTKGDAPVPHGTAALQLAFKVERDVVDACAAALGRSAVALVSPPTDQVWGHRTLFFRDPDGNLLEIYAEI